MKIKFLVALAFCMMALSGCYTATIETNLPPSNTKIEKNWAAGWIFGLVPPKTVETAAQCPHGVAKVVTQLSFANMLVGFLTLDIYVPMTIQVTCAQASETSLVDPKDTFAVSKDASPKEFRNVFMMAAEKVAQSESEVFVMISETEQNQVKDESLDKITHLEEIK